MWVYFYKDDKKEFSFSISESSAELIGLIFDNDVIENLPMGKLIGNICFHITINMLRGSRIVERDCLHEYNRMYSLLQKILDFSPTNYKVNY